MGLTYLTTMGLEGGNCGCRAWVCGAGRTVENDVLMRSADSLWVTKCKSYTGYTTAFLMFFQAWNAGRTFARDAGLLHINGRVVELLHHIQHHLF